MLRSLFLFLFVSGLCGAFVTPATAADPKGTVAIELKDVDEDYAYQGEYLGATRDAWCRCVSTGLQVVALGDGKFQAVEYLGGLPGYGWPIGGQKAAYQGTREGRRLTLTGEKNQIVIENGHAIIRQIGNYDAVIGQAGHVQRQSPTQGACPPCNAIVLFDGTNTDHFKNGQMTPDGLLKEGTETKDAFGDMQMHLEFLLPYMPAARGQGRGNSGVYLQSRYEVQVLDSFGLDGAFNECGSLYRQRQPDLNMCLPPLVWQTYDIWLRSAQFDTEGHKVCDAVITVWHNGVAVHDNVAITGKTGAGSPETPALLPTKLQNHSNPVRFRNMWLVRHN